MTYFLWTWTLMVVTIDQNTEKVKFSVNKTFFVIALERQMLLDSLKKLLYLSRKELETCSLVGRPDHREVKALNLSVTKKVAEDLGSDTRVHFPGTLGAKLEGTVWMFCLF